MFNLVVEIQLLEYEVRLRRLERSFNYKKCAIVHHCSDLYQYPSRRIIRQIRTNLEGFLVSRNRREKIITVGAYHLTDNVGNFGWKVNGKVTFRKFQPKIEEYVLRQSFHSGWYKPNGMSLTIYHFSVPSRFQTRATQILPFFGFKP